MSFFNSIFKHRFGVCDDWREFKILYGVYVYWSGGIGKRKCRVWLEGLVLVVL